MNKDIPFDETLMEMSRQLDDFLFNMCENNQIPFLQLAALVLARLGVISKEINEEQQLIRLMKLSEIHLNSEKTIFNATPSDQIH